MTPTIASRCNIASKLSESVRQRLNRFAIATILAGVGLLALAWPAAAEIVYTPANINIKHNSSYNLDLNNDGITDFTISTVYQSVRRPCYGYHGQIIDYYQAITAEVNETPASGDGVEGAPPAELNSGDQIGPSQTYYGGQGTLRHFVSGQEGGSCKSYSFHTGNWSGINHYLGLMFQINGEIHYGWAELNVGNGTATLTGYAYETAAGTPINAGQEQ